MKPAISPLRPIQARRSRRRLVGKAIGTTLISGVLFAALVAFADYAG
jgi:hypothetical protein